MKGITLAFVIAVASLCFAQDITCGPEDSKYRADTDEVNHPTLDATPGKAVLYVLRPSSKTRLVMARLAIDGQWVGANRGHNYFVVSVEPGKHALCSRSGVGTAVSDAEFEAGKVYYLEQRLDGGWVTPAKEETVFIDEPKGKELVAKLKLSVMSKKQ